MIRTILIDDEPLARSIIKEYLASYPEVEVLQECNDGFEGIKAIQQHQPDLIFLDIQMPRISGFEMLELVDDPPSVIFTTAFDEYAVKAFEAHAVDYLLKPFSKARFDDAMQNWMSRSQKAGGGATAIMDDASRQPEQSQRVVIKTGTKIRIIPVEDIHYLEADDDYVRVHTAEGSFLKKKTMSHFEQVLDPAMFTRVHRSYILQLSQLSRIDSPDNEHHFAVLKSGAKIPLSRSGYPRLKAVLGV